MAADMRMLQREKSKSSKDLFNWKIFGVIKSRRKIGEDGRVTGVDENA